MKTLLLGIDDAGRGPVVGPMILAGCLVDEHIGEELRALGVRDSKQLTQKRREFLDEEIKEKSFDHEIISISPTEIDSGIAEGTNLNELEAIACAKIIDKINSRSKSTDSEIKIKVVVDCPSNSILKWTDILKRYIKDLSNLEISCEHKADQNHVSVSAASILAKSQREREMDKLRKRYGVELGSGYSSDPATKKFLEKNIKNHDK
ncbi:MAG: ribonuclease HII, partial [Nanoarchaeota archaeon]|nr:ribonuclease HII [Nanoarchaeota archaeon]